MARIDIKTTITAPNEINIPLVRADHNSISNIFRIFFEIFLSILAGLLGHILSLQVLETIHYVIMILFGFFTLIFLGMTVYYNIKSKKY